MRTLILGGNGMLGRALAREARRRHLPVLALGHTLADITDRATLSDWIERFRPRQVINCAAFTKVDACEEHRQEAMAINGEAVANVVEAVAPHTIPLIQVSSDYVFDGKATTPYGEEAPTAPLSVYGQSKLLGETEALRYDQALVVRSSWLYGPWGSNFVATMVRLIEHGRDELRVVEDQVGCPTYTPYLAGALLDLAALRCRGVIHYCNRDPVSWYEFTREIVRSVRPGVRVTAISTREFEDSVSYKMAPRPAYSVLDVRRFEEALARPVERWSAGLQAYLEHLRSDRERS